MRIKHLYTDDDGRARFGELEIPWMADSPPDMQMTVVIPVRGIQFLKKARTHGLSGGQPYPPRLVMNLVGSARLGVSSGETWEFGPGGVLLSADGGSDGHSSQQLSDPRLLLLAPLDDSVDISSWRV